jgi:hypothetical protein
VEEEDEEWVRGQELAKAPELLLDRERVPGLGREQEVAAVERVLPSPT